MVYKNFEDKIPEINQLEPIGHYSDGMMLLEPAHLTNPHKDSKISFDFPSYDQQFYKSLEAQLDHILFKWKNDWIKSPRQLMFNSDECVSIVHFKIDPTSCLRIDEVRVFCRSTNMKQIEHDVQFFKYYIKKLELLGETSKNCLLDITLSMPHYFL